jgi:hypothetical protein
MSLISIEFDELYARHLCRHSQLGINVVHLAALFGVWFGVYGVVYWLIRGVLDLFGLAPSFPLPEWVMVGLAVSYLVSIAPNVPLRVLAAVAVFLAVFVTSLLLVLPALPPWMVGIYLLLVPVCYKLQAQSHKWYHIEHDMTEFNRKYTKGFVLFVVLLFYEVPILLHYLVFGRKDWVT